MPLRQPTYCAPAECAAPDVLETLSTEALADPVVILLLEAVHGYLFIVDRHRQLIAANSELIARLGNTDLASILGQRTGELFQCSHAHECSGGCGTSKDCRKCGALLTLLASQRSDQVTDGECIISAESNGRKEELTFSVRCTPLELNGEKTTAILLIDISDERRRDLLENIFIHDINNILTGLIGYGELLKLGAGDTMAKAIVNLSEQLNEEIRSHEAIIKAEKGLVAVHSVIVPVEDLLARLEEIFVRHGVKGNRSINIRLKSRRTKLYTDRSLLMRVLINMVKNALEATLPGGEVVIEFERRNGFPVFRVWNAGIIPVDVAKNIFIKSFSTKKGKYRGFGTYSMKLLGEQFLGGRVNFSSSNDDGTWFEIELPDEKATIAQKSTF